MNHSPIVYIPRVCILRIHGMMEHRDPESRKKTIVWGIVTVGTFADENELELWKKHFSFAASHHGVTVSIFERRIWPLAKVTIDFDHETEDGLPWEVADQMTKILPIANSERLIRLSARKRALSAQLV